MYRPQRLLNSSLARHAALSAKPTTSTALNLGRRALSTRPAQSGSLGASRLALLLAVASASAVGGYAVASQSSPKAAFDPLVTPSYATKAQIQEAVKELQSLFPAEAVSTDPDVLKVHGYSVRAPQYARLNPT